MYDFFIINYYSIIFLLSLFMQLNKRGRLYPTPSRIRQPTAACHFCAADSLLPPTPPLPPPLQGTTSLNSRATVRSRPDGWARARTSGDRELAAAEGHQGSGVTREGTACVSLFFFSRRRTREKENTLRIEIDVAFRFQKRVKYHREKPVRRTQLLFCPHRSLVNIDRRTRRSDGDVHACTGG